MSLPVHMDGHAYVLTREESSATGVSVTTALPATVRPRLVVYGDSFSKDNAVAPDPGWARIVAATLGADLTNHAQGGTGYLQDTYGLGAFGERVRAAPPDGDVVVIFGSVNDVNGARPAPAVQDAAAATLAAVRAAAPAAAVLVIGPQWPDTPPPPGAGPLRDAVRTAAGAADAVFLDALTWLAGRPELIGPDGLHPNAAGQRHLAGLIRPAVAQLARLRA